MLPRSSDTRLGSANHCRMARTLAAARRYLRRYFWYSASCGSGGAAAPATAGASAGMGGVRWHTWVP